MHRHSPLGPISIGTVLVLVIIGVAVLASLNKNITNEQAQNNQSATTTAVSNQTYTFQNVTVQYPSDWSIQENTYVNPAGNGGVVGATFTPAHQKDMSDQIGIGGQQVTCETFNTDQITCTTIGDLPIYTGSKNPDVLAVFSTMIATASTTQPAWMKNTNELAGYSIEFKRDMTAKDNQPYPSEPSSGNTSTVFSFPAKFLEGSTYAPDSAISVSINDTTCEAVYADNTLVNTQSIQTKKIGSLTFQFVSWGDAGAGNRYETQEYSIEKNNSCYLISLFTHYGSPANVGDSPEAIDTLEAKNTEVKKNMKAIFDHMVSSFTFIK